MSEATNRTDELTPFETALTGLTPRVAGLDRERLLFLAGRAAALGELAPRRTRLVRWGWPAAFAAMTAVAASLTAMICMRPAANDAIAGAEPPSAVSPLVATAQEAPSYVHLRDEILERGFDAERLRASTASTPATVAEGPLPYQRLLGELLDEKRSSL
jgi:hypothetical protein